MSQEPGCMGLPFSAHIHSALLPHSCLLLVTSDLTPEDDHDIWAISFLSFLSASPASPMGDILQTPQFQMRRLKKQLADERNNRDELELELAENRKLLTERGGYWHTVCTSGQHLGFPSREQWACLRDGPLLALGLSG